MLHSLNLMAEYDFEVGYLSVNKNVIVDYLS